MSQVQNMNLSERLNRLPPAPPLKGSPDSTSPDDKRKEIQAARKNLQKATLLEWTKPCGRVGGSVSGHCRLSSGTSFPTLCADGRPVPKCGQFPIMLLCGHLPSDLTSLAGRS
jgi:hypothetical protein